MDDVLYGIPLVWMQYYKIKYPPEINIFTVNEFHL